jgi:hypothetical protein
MADSPTPATVRSPATPDRRARPLDLAALGVVALVLRIPALVASRHLTFDDGVFGASALAMRDGGQPFRDVFSSQGPLFLPLVWLGDVVGLRTLNSPRVVAIMSGVALVLAVYWAALAITDRAGALVAGALTATAGSVLWVTGPLAADGPALAFAVAAFGLALRQRDRPAAGRAVVLGAAVGAALSTKAIEAHVLVPVGLVLVAPILAGLRGEDRRLDARAAGLAVLAGAAAVVVFVAASVPWGWADVWDQSVTYRTDAADARDPLGNLGKLLSTLWSRDLTLYLFGSVAAVLGVLAYRDHDRARPDGVDDDQSWAGAGDGRPSGRLLVVVWVTATALWLVVAVSPLWRAHVSAIVPPLALLIGLYRPSGRALVATALVSLPLVALQAQGALLPGPYEDSEAEVVARLRSLPEGAWVLSDEPGLVWRAGRRTTDDLVDPSMLRVQQGRYDEDSLVAAAADPQVCAVVVRSADRFGAFDDLGSRLAAEGYDDVVAYGGPRMLYVRSDCDPPAS